LQDQVAEAWASVDVPRFIQSIYATNTVVPMDEFSGAASESIKSALQQQTSNILKYTTIFQGCAGSLDVVVNRRCMTRAEGSSSSSLSAFSAIAHLDSNWSRGRLVHVFFQGKPVLAFVVPTSAANGVSDAGNSTLNAIAMPSLPMNVKFEEDEDDAVPAVKLEPAIVKLETAEAHEEETARKRSKKQ
jgi:hypothetical protein